MDSKPLVSDEEYDKLFSELDALEDSFPELRARSSPTQVVGSSLRRGKNGVDLVAHTMPMLSLANAFSMEDVRNFDARVKRMSGSSDPSYVVEFKYDGIALALHYENGKFVRALTRGDGKMGEDVSGAIRRFLPQVTRDLTNYAQYGTHIEIRGESFLTKEAFQHFNTDTDKSFTNARNLASGLLKRKLSSTEVSSESDVTLSFVGYNLLVAKGASNTHWETLEAISSLGIPIGHPYLKRIHDIDAFKQLEQEWATKRSKLPFEADGLVLKVDAVDLYERLGCTSHSPRFALAWKFSAKQATTIINSIELSVGRTGKVTPVANVAPVRLAGSLISRATLHNRDYIEKNRLVPGCSVTIERSGDVIPKIVGRVDDLITGDEHPPSSTSSCSLNWSVCPCNLQFPLNQTGNVDYTCTNPICPPQRLRQLEHFSAALEIEGLGPSSLKQLVDLGIVSDFGDIFGMKDQNLLKLRTKDGWGDKKIDNLLAQIEAAKHRATFSTLLFAIGIPHIGKEKAATLAERVGSIKQLMKCSTQDLEKLDDIGPIVARSISSYFSQPSSVARIQALDSLCIGNAAITTKPIIHDATNAVSSRLAGQTIVFTGSLTSMSRKEAEHLVKAAGGSPKSNITKSTNYLVEGLAPSTSGKTSSKLELARQLNVTILTETQFFELLNSQ